MAKWRGGVVMSIEKSPTDTYPMRLLNVGDKVKPVTYDNIVTVLACWLLRPSDVDAYAVWVVLCHLPENERHPFAVWDAYDRPEGWSFGEGDYCVDIASAMKRYLSRANIDPLGIML
jgi:hypothetical protein